MFSYFETKKRLNMLNYTNFKFCPNCGRETLSILEQNAMVCNSCGLKYFHNTAAAVGGIITTPKGIVLAERACEPSKGMLDIPGGFANYNESLENALRRELFEELHIQITRFRYIASFPNEYTYAGVTYFTIDSMFLVEWDPMFTLTPSDEIARIQFADIKNIDFDKLAFSSTRKLFAYIIENGIIR
jgi:ADP-ribose pyrophosphatase YjhB (NUDIX family)